MLVAMVMVAVVMAATVMAAAGGGRLAGAGRVLVGRRLGRRLLPGTLQHLQLHTLLAASAPQGHPSFPGDGVHPGWLHRRTLPWTSGPRRVLRGVAAPSREPTFGGAQGRLLFFPLRLRMWSSTGIGRAGLVGFSYG